MISKPAIYKDKPIRKIMSSILIIIVIAVSGTLAYMVFDGLSFFTAAYQTLIVISTLGIRDNTQGFAGELISFFLIIGGVGAVAFAVSSIISIVVEGKLRTVMGRRLVNAKISSISGHYIICGYGRMGKQVCDRLSQKGEKVVVIENEDSKTAKVEADGYLYVLGNASEESSLNAAGIGKATGLVSVLPSDADNVFVALTARALNPGINIVSRAETTDSIAKIKRAGATNAVSPHAIGASKIAWSLTNPAFTKFLDKAALEEAFEMAEIEIPEDSSLNGKKLSETHIREEAQVLVISVVQENGHHIFNPPSNFVISAGDQLLYIGTPGAEGRLQKILGS